MTRYVATMIYHEEANAFIGVHKTRGPQAIVGKVNFIGGKVERGESDFNAHIREAREEVGIHLNPNWAGEAIELQTTSGDTVSFMLFTIPRGKPVPEVPEHDDVGQKLEWVLADYLDQYDLVPNLRYLVPMLLDKDRPHGVIFEAV